MTLIHRLTSYGFLTLLVTLVSLMVYSSFRYDPNWHVVEQAVASTDHPLAGFWKRESCDEPWGWAIGPAEADSYYVSICAPGGCQTSAGQEATTTTITDDPDFFVINLNTMRYQFDGDWVTLVRCANEN